MKLTPVGRTPVAKRVSDAILACSTDAEAQLLATMIIGAGVQHDMIEHRDVVQANINKCVDAQVYQVSKALARATVHNIQKNRDADSLITMQAEIKKIFNISKDEYTPEERAQNARQQGRNALGQFKTTHHKLNYSEKNAAMPDRYAAAWGIPPANNINPADKMAYQEAYQQIQTMLGPYTALDPGESILHLNWTNKDGTTHTQTVDMPQRVTNGKLNVGEAVKASNFRGGGRITSVAVSHNPNLSVQGASFDLVGALGEQPGSMAARSMARVDGSDQFAGAQRLGTFQDQWNRTAIGNDNIGNNRRLFGRLGLGSRLLSDIAGDNAPSKVKIALQSGEFVSQYGQEAEKVIGPHADRIAYRYRGVERKPDASLQANINRYRGLYGNNDAARNALIYGLPDETATKGGIKSTQKASPIIEYFRGRLADKNLIQLQSQSGVIPPSEGIIIDRKGKVITQAVGYGDDWYLPFNLKTLSQVKGGEYVRTRAWGGPTTEDIYAGLVSGARAVTVISHNGVYTIEFDESFRGSRRYNDKAARMVKRYGHLLDAVKSKQVTLSGIPEDRLEELKAEAAKRYNPKTDRVRFNGRLDELKKEERIEPTMSAARKDQIAREFLDEQAQNLPGKHGADHEADWTDFAANYVDRNIAEMRRNHPTYPGAPEFDEPFYRDMLAANVRTPEQIIGVAKLGDPWQKYLAAKDAEYKAEQSPLNLDGPGYDKSMKALQEQFPYYISNTSWQPNLIGGTDVGYVKPRHNRPERALAGYFDTTIEGTGKQLTIDNKPTGKVTADQVRWQNGRGPDRYEARGASARPADGPGSGGRIVPGGGGGAGGGAGGGDNLSPEGRLLRDQEAVSALYDHYNAKAVYDKGDAAGAAVNREHTKQAMPLMFGAKEDLMSEFAANPEEVKRRILTEIDRGDRAFNRPTELVNRLRNPSAQDVGGAFNVVAGMSSPNKNYNFGDEFGPGRTPDEYLGTIHGLADHLNLAADRDDLDAIDTGANATITAASALIRRNASNPAVDADRVEDARKELEDAVKLKQAIRRHKKAAQLEEEARAARDQNGGGFGFNQGPGTVNITVPLTQPIPGQANPFDVSQIYNGGLESQMEQWGRDNR